MSEKRVKLNQIVKNQLPSYVQEDFPLVGNFLSQYYQGQEYQGGPIDLINNIDSYIKLSECGNVIKNTNTTRFTGISTFACTYISPLELCRKILIPFPRSLN